MSEQLNCPVCGELVDLATEGACSVCGAFLTAEMLSQAEAPVPEDNSISENTGEPASRIAADELEAAFRSQFDGHGIRLPQRWVTQLRALATEVEASRRFATAFFIDLRGYTAMSRMMSEDQLDRLRQWFYSVVTQRVEQYGGFVIQLVGDAVFAAFGAPWAFERDSESALRALLDIREDIRAKGDFDGYPLAIRAGADFGPLNVRLTETQGQVRPDLFGSTVNLAARLEANAETWEILISDNMAVQVQDLFDLEPRPGFVPKNYGREVRPFAVIGARADTSKRRRHDLAFVGRQNELHHLTACLDKVQSGVFHSVRVVGDAGVGKTRLVLEMLGNQDVSKVAISMASCEPHSRFVLFQAALQLTRRAAAILANRPPDSLGNQEVLEILSAALKEQTDQSLIPTLGYLLQLEPYASEVRSLPAGTLRLQAVTAVAELFVRLASLRPWIIFLDDMQWCDRLTREAIELLLRQAPPGLLMICVGRDDSDPDDYFESPQTESGFEVGAAGFSRVAPIPFTEQFKEEIALGPLSDEDRDRLLGQIVDMASLHPALQQRLRDESEGVPFYLIELARELSERMGTPLSDMLAERAAEESAVELPPTLLGILQARIDRLTSQRRAVLQCAAIFGRRFSYSLLSLYDALREDLLSELYALKGLRMVRDEPIPADIEFVFTPTALRNVAYHMLTQQQRESLHRTVALLIEKAFAGRTEQFVYDLAFHWVRGKDIGRGRRYIRQAVQQALLLGVPQDAYELLRKALESASSQGAAQAESGEDLLQMQQRGLLEEAGGKACRTMGDYCRAQEHFQALLDVAEKTGNQQWRANAQLQMGATSLEQGHLDVAESRLRPLVGEDSLPALIKCRIRNSLAAVCYRKGNLDEAKDLWLNAARDAAAETSADLVRADCLNNLGLVRWQAGELATAVESFQNALALWERQNSAYGRVITLCNLGIVEEKLGNLGKAMASYNEATVIAERIGYFHGLSALEANRANISLLIQDFQQAQEQAARALKYARVIGHRNSETVALNNLGLAFGGLGLIDEAFDAFRKSASIGEAASDRNAVANARLGHASVAAAANRLDDARAAFAGNLVPETLPAHLEAWYMTVNGIVESLERQSPSDLFLPGALDQFKQDATVENYVRRLDAVAVLHQYGVAVPISAGDISHRRRQSLGDLSH